MSDVKKIVVAITGASGVHIGVRLLEVLGTLGYERHLIVSPSGAEVLKLETGKTMDDLLSLAEYTWNADELTAPVASGSYKFDGMIIAPCSMRTLGSVSSGADSSLIGRCADVCLKERRMLILMVRETPLSLIHLENMVKVTEAGGVVLPASPAYYYHPKDIQDCTDFLVGRILDVMGISHTLYQRWGEGER